MTTFKKIIAVMLTLAVLLSAVILTVSADSAPVINISGRSQVEIEDSYFVDVSVSGADVGGTQGTIAFDTTALKYVGIEFSDAFKEVNPDADGAVKVNADEGKIAFIGINPGNNVVWFTVEFEVIGEAKENTIALDDSVLGVMVAAADGTVYAETEFVAPEIDVVEKGQVEMLGGTIRGVGGIADQDLKVFAAVNYNDEDLAIEEYGIIFIPSQLLKGQELVADVDYNYGTAEKPVKAAFARIKSSHLGKDVDPNKLDLTATLRGSASYNAGSLLQVDMSSRAYIKLSDGTVIYSNNDLKDTFIEDGYAKKSIIGIAKSMAGYILGLGDQSKVNYTIPAEDVETIVKETGKLSTENDNALSKALLNFVVTNKALLPKA